jgi:TonB family protein
MTWETGSGRNVMMMSGACLLLISCVCEAQDRVCVQDAVAPDYPVLARMASLEGPIKVKIEVSESGVVRSATASGGDPILLREVERNVKQWTFRLSPGERNLPYTLTMTYVFKLKGEPVDYPSSPTVVFHFPDSVEITAERPRVNVQTSRAVPGQ